MLALLAVPILIAGLVNPVVLTLWWLWVLYAVAAVIGFRTESRQYLAAGADWLQGRGSWVDVYQLTEIVVAAGTAQHWITFVDAEGRRSTQSTNDLQANPALWDLVYNGIRHSVADGATVRGTGARNLRPPGAP
ncbi:hypothetical protein [Actinomycetospora termitidis]|uniref:Uncharacterized protein n=1 Tax=Actinomycetospora termitidis TaxID=3053470 RepID=A0ABT7MI02_9PSEU|nr:hypothetical protein [Actinomycetospora sp. Odt1-22]MDL5159824.1 hypothetical protein [Actinomycetospora sp. Odt1-22]